MFNIFKLSLNFFYLVYYLQFMLFNLSVINFFLICIFRFLSSFNRPNLLYKVVPKKGKSALVEIANLIKEKYKNQSGIIYCFSRKDCDSTAAFMCTEGIKASSYHAGLTDQKRNEVQMKWLTNKFNVFVYLFIHA